MQDKFWQHLESVDVSHISVHPVSGFPAREHGDLINFVTHFCPKLRNLAIGHNPGGLGALADVLPAASSLRSLSAPHAATAAIHNANYILPQLTELEELDLSWAKRSEIFLGLFSDPATGQKNRKLRRLTLTGAAMPEDFLGRVLRSCEALESLELDSVRSIPRGFPRRAQNKADVDAMRKRYAKLR